MLDLTINLINNLIIYPDNMLFNLNLTRGLAFSQTVLLKLVDKGLTREEAYKIVQTAAMNVWNDKNKYLKDELLNSEEVTKYLSESDLSEIFDNKRMLNNVEYIFNRSIFSGE
jgi:adenylosuccinate lyase